MSALMWVDFHEYKQENREWWADYTVWYPANVQQQLWLFVLLGS